MTGAYERDHVLSVSAAVTIGDQTLIHCEFETKGRGVLALYGRSGAGKSTLLRLIMGRETPRGGRAEVVASNAVIVDWYASTSGDRRCEQKV